MKRLTIFILISTFTSTIISAQKNWSLQQCINHSIENNLSIQQAKIAIQQAELQYKSNKRSQLPTANLNTNLGMQFGRTIDLTTNQFITQNVGFNSFNLNASANIFNGHRIKNSIKQSYLDIQANQRESQATINNLALNITNTYLQILLAQEQKDNALQQLNLSNQQLLQTDKLIEAGTLPHNDRLDLEVAQARNQQNLIIAENNIQAGYINLKNLLQLDLNSDFSIQTPKTEVPQDQATLTMHIEEIYLSALQTQPQIEAQQLRTQSAKLSEKIAAAGKIPSISIFAGLNTNWSSEKPDLNSPDFSDISVEFSPPVPVEINGESASLSELRTIGQVKFPDQKYFDQINENFGQNIGISLNIPIYNNSRNDINQQRAQLSTINQSLIQEQTKQNLKAEIQTALGNAQSSHLAYQAAQKSLNSATQAYDNATKRFSLGIINSLELATSQLNLNLAQSEATAAKYQFIFNLKVLDFYLGKDLSL